MIKENNKRYFTVILALMATGMFAQTNENKISDNAVDTIKAKEIQEVLIKAQKKKQFSDHANYTFDKEALEKARHSKDLLITLPELQLDPISNTVISIKGGRILFLINGVEATDNQIKSVAPTNVVRVEYFDIPPARYLQRADTVVNIITKNPEVGYSFGADLTSAFTTGFVNGSAYGGYTKGKNDFGLEYTINLRDYNNRIVDKTYEYDLNQIHYRSAEQQKDHFGYTYQNIGLRYSNTDSGKYVFQAKLNMILNSSFLKGTGQSIFTMNNNDELHHTVHNSNSNYTNPTLDLYYSKNIGKKDELSLNVIGSYFNTKSYQFDHEWKVGNYTDIFNNDMNLKAKQTGIVGEIAHVHNFEKGKLSSGYRVSNTSIDNDLVNLLGAAKYSVNYLEQYLYTEYSGKKDKLSYRLGIGLTQIHNKSAQITQDDWAPTPKVVLSYELPKNQFLRFVTQYTSQSPFASALSSNVVQVVPNIVQKGNPYLKTQHVFKNSLIYSFSSKYFDLNTTFFYNIADKYFAQFYQLDPETEGYALTYENAESYSEKGVQISGSIKPFGNSLLVLKTYIAPTATKLTSVNGTEYTRNFVRNNFALISQYKNFSAYYQFNIPVFSLNGSFLTKDENQSHFLIAYQHRSWTFTTGMYWVGTPSKYYTKSLPGDWVAYTNKTNIYNNKNMFVLGLSYDFSSGKKLQIQKKLNNSTAPASTF
ncbi:outer membrane beta-barrel protein [Chryseobacterium geocarposphaerae]|uniref:Outer membrane receptor protein involved in Fe transport n=1 Tax=Chryseobacterium geocarposphaerae TaxID=1416776 RepID=A0A2M9CA94_9FLAO|nr:outer membrane beta-barrel protein [Chryseobacterium geocarposphaerae]PJJ67731.1 outer membrane receptor protein involved in Fe transport [Chryseobacterium geocarposphaerae]